MVLERVLAESKVNRIGADIMVVDATALEPLHQEKILQAVPSPAIADLIPQAVPAHREWIPIYLNGFVQAYNTSAVKKEDLPHSWHDLTKPQWKGKLGVEAKDYDWFAEVVLALGEKEGLDIFREIVARNGISVRVGHTLLTNLVVSGEVPMGLTPYDYSVEQRKAAGAPVDWMLIPPAIAKPSGVGVVRTAKHPNAAVLFRDFCIGGGQDLLASRHFTTVTRRIHPPFLNGEVKIVDTALMLGRAQKWSDLYKKTLLEQAK
jgi:iron(III) transport system substrate-binding protein